MRLLLAAALMFLSGSAMADAFPSPEAARTFLDQTMAKIGKGDIEEGLRQIKPYMAIPTAEVDAMLGQVSLQIPAMAQRFGKPMGHEFISEMKAGESLVRLLYVQKFEKHGLRWRFLLYKGGSGWIINTFTFDAQLHDLFLP